MLDVFFTVDVEIWCDGWEDIDKKFPDAFKKYIYGPTAKGDFGLPFQLNLLKQYDFTGVFFTEPLFASRFGVDPLSEIVGLISDAGQEVQLHLHTEWVDESSLPLLPVVGFKRQHLRQFSKDEQIQLIAAGINLLQQAGLHNIGAFRAGSFGFNRDTLKALAINQIKFDSSYNASLFGLDSGVLPGVTATDVFECDGINEYPMTVFNDGTKTLRHAQVGACSAQEIEGLLWEALREERRAFVILSHNFELLNRAKDRGDDVVVSRFRQLLKFLDKNRDSFRVRGFNGLNPLAADVQPSPLVSPLWKTGARMVEQAYRRKYR